MNELNEFKKLTAAKLLQKSERKSEMLSVRLSPELLDLLDLLSAKTGKAKGVVAKIILENGVVQMADYMDCLDPLQKLTLTR